MLTDIEGSVRRWEAAPAAMRDALRRHDAILRGAMLRDGGHIFRTVGDSFHTAFSLPSSALGAAVSGVRALARENFAAVDGLRIRVALHAGPVESRDGDYFGQGINRAARLLSLANPGQILVSGTVARMIEGELPVEVTLLDLGNHFLRDRTDAERVYQVMAADLPGTFPPLRSPGNAPSNLPRGTTSFVGRAREMNEIKATFERARLVTLLGNGGAGKTRLATEVAAQLSSRFPDGLWFVDFSTVEDAQVVAEKVATVVGARSTANQSGAASVLAWLRDKTCLLILDNCEHLLTAAAELTQLILQACPLVSVLATSRQPLALGAEHLIRLSNLDLPGKHVSPTDAVKFPAIQLFVDRAAATSSFLLDEENVDWVIDICRRLDGIPLAIELAAPQLRLARPERLVELLEASFSMETPFRGVPDRHQTLATTLDWSYRLLRGEEKVIFERLGVLTSGGTMTSVMAVCGDPDVGEQAMSRLIAGLVDKSLIVADLSGSEARFRLLETTRAYALAKLEERGDSQVIRRRFASHMRDVFSSAYQCWPTLGTEQWIAAYGPELDNMRASLDWAFSPQGDDAIAMELVSFSLRLWDELGLLPERQRWFDRALASANATLIPAGVHARLFLGRTSLSAAADPARFGIAEHAIDLLRTLPVGIDLGEALARAGAALLTPTTVDKAAPYLLDAHRTLSDFGPTKQLAACLRSMCAMQFFQGDFLGARRYGLEAESVSRKIGDAYGLISNQINLAEVDFASGEVDRAISIAQGVLKAGKGSPTLLAVCEANLASYLLSAERFEDAKAAAVGALSQARALSWPEAVARALEHLAFIGLLAGSAHEAAQLLGYIENCSEDWAATQQPIERLLHERVVEEVSRRIAPDTLILLREAGASWSEDEAVEVALKSVGQGS